MQFGIFNVRRETQLYHCDIKAWWDSLKLKDFNCGNVSTPLMEYGKDVVAYLGTDLLHQAYVPVKGDSIEFVRVRKPVEQQQEGVIVSNTLAHCIKTFRYAEGWRIACLCGEVFCGNTDSLARAEYFKHLPQSHHTFSYQNTSRTCYGICSCGWVNGKDLSSVGRCEEDWRTSHINYLKERGKL